MHGGGRCGANRRTTTLHPSECRLRPVSRRAGRPISWPRPRTRPGGATEGRIAPGRTPKGPEVSRPGTLVPGRGHPPRRVDTAATASREGPCVGRPASRGPPGEPLRGTRGDCNNYEGSWASTAQAVTRASLAQRVSVGGRGRPARRRRASASPRGPPARRCLALGGRHPGGRRACGPTGARVDRDRDGALGPDAAAGGRPGRARARRRGAAARRARSPPSWAEVPAVSTGTRPPPQSASFTRRPE